MVQTHTDPIITLTTDFGTGSPYVAQMKGVILSLHAAVRIVDITHGIRPQDVRQAAIVLADVTPLFPKGTLHVAVVDPGVGSQREILCVRVGGQVYIAPDNGLLSFVTREAIPEAIIALANPQYWRARVSTTFHGRDIMACAAAHLCLGTPPEQLGPPRQGLVGLPWPAVETAPRSMRGSVLEIDSFGNVISNISREQMAAIPPGATARVTCRGQATSTFVDYYGQQSTGTLVALWGSSGRLELAVCGASAARALQAAVGDPLEITW